MLNELLANPAEDQLIELHYGNRGLLSTNKLLLGTENCFSNPEAQRKLQSDFSLQTRQSIGNEDIGSQCYSPSLSRN